jgi:integrase
MVPAVRAALKLVLITAQRPGEVAGIHTSEIDGNWWTIPAERSKNKKSHRVYLTPLAQEIVTGAIAHVKRIREIPAETKYEGFIFPCRHTGKAKPLQRLALSRSLLRNATPDGETTLGVEPFTPHDLRRTAATQMSKLKFHDETIDAVLNHSKKGVISTYNQNRYDDEKQQALEV